jgi:hypothetical protein
MNNEVKETEYYYKELIFFKRLFITHILEMLRENIRLTGSSALKLGVFENMIEKIDHLPYENTVYEFERDIDIILTLSSYNKVIGILKDKGDIISDGLNLNNPYLNGNLTTKGIIRIEKHKLIFNKKTTDIGAKMILEKYKILSFSLNIDLVIMHNYSSSLQTTIDYYSKEWAIHCSMRNICCYIKANCGLFFDTFKKNKLYIKTNKFQKKITVNWIIESLKYILWKEQRYLLYNEKIIHIYDINNKCVFDFNANKILNSAIFMKNNYEYLEIPYELLKQFIEFTHIDKLNIDKLNIDKLNIDKLNGYCVICQENLNNNCLHSTIASLKCGCMFHSSCIILMLLPFLQDYVKQISRCEYINKPSNDITEPMVYQLLPNKPIGLKCPNCCNQLFSRSFGKKVIPDLPGIECDYIMELP